MATLRTLSLKSPLFLSIIKPLIYILFLFIGTGFCHVVEPTKDVSPIVSFPKSHTCGVSKSTQLNKFFQDQTIDVVWSNDSPGECSIYLSSTGEGTDFQMIKSFPNCGKDFHSSITLPNVVTRNGILRFQWSPESTGNTVTSCADVSISSAQNVKKQKRKRNNVKRIPSENIEKRDWWGGWWKRSAEPELEKRDWWGGWWKRSSEPELEKRDWWGGWWKRSASPESVPELKKRDWWGGWWKRSASPESESLEKRDWWGGWWKRSASPESESLEKRDWWGGWWKRSASPESESLEK
ncbi:7507_t:CDS:2, partial [Racocetra persica]